LFPQGKVNASRAHLREEVRDFADRKGFTVATDGNKICCTRSLEPISQAKARAKKNASGLCQWRNAGLTNHPRVVNALSELQSPGCIRGTKTILPLESMDPEMHRRRQITLPFCRDLGARFTNSPLD
jgi:hypothetical protein